MYEDTVVSFSHPDKISVPDPLTEALRAGARRLLALAEKAFDFFAQAYGAKYEKAVACLAKDREHQTQGLSLT